jgi:hypothetical protein
MDDALNRGSVFWPSPAVWLQCVLALQRMRPRCFSACGTTLRNTLAVTSRSAISVIR